MRHIFLLGFGAPLADILVPVTNDFIAEHVGDKGGMAHWSIEQQQDALRAADNKFSVANGGSAGNTVNCLANLGAPVAMLGMTGDDELGEKYRNELAGCGGSTDYLFTHPTAPTGRCISFITPDSERTMRSNLGASSMVSKTEVDKVDFSDIEIVYFEGYRLFEMETFEYALSKARAAGCRIAIDFASFNVVELFHDKLKKLYDEKVFDMIFLNEEESEAFFGDNDHRKNLADATSKCSVAVIKLGKEGALISAGNNIIPVASVKCRAVDTTGAGDSWAGGFFYGVYRAFDWAKCGMIGAEVSSRVVAVEGAKLPQNTWDMLKKSFI